MEDNRESSTKMPRIASKVAATALAASLVLCMAPISASAASSSSGNSTSSSQGGTPPSSGGGSGDQGSSGQGGTPPDAGGSGGGQAPSGGGGANTMSFDYSGSYTGALSVDGTAVTSTDESYNATDTDQNAATIQNGGALVMTGGTLSKSGDDTNGDNCNFYGLNSILTAVGSASTAYVATTTLQATSEGSNGIFSTDGATVYASDDTITTTAGNSRGLDATYDGTIVADGLDISTQGDHCASVATDRGGGNVSVTNSTFATAGSGSPLLYSTGDIEVSGVTGTASGSQICGMEGLNTILIDNSNLTSTNDAISGSDPVENGVIIYQSTSGDAESTTGQAATFQATDSTLTSTISSGSMFYLTNTEANIILSNTTLDFDSSNVDLLMAEGNDSNNWGTAGSNGAQVNFTGIGETLSGDIDVDTISSVDLYLLDASTYSGTTTINTNATNTSVQDSNLIMNVDGASKWVVTGDSTVDELNVADGGQVVDAQGNTVTIIADGATVVSGTSPYTVIANDSYSTTVSTSDTNAVQSAGVDRSGFDSYYDTSTAFLTDGVSATTSQNASAASTSTSAKTTLESVISSIDSYMTSKAS